MANIDELLLRLDGKYRSPIGGDEMAEKLGQMAPPSPAPMPTRAPAAEPAPTLKAAEEKPDYLTQAILSFGPALGGMLIGGTSGAAVAKAGTDAAGKFMDEQKRAKAEKSKLDFESENKRLERDREDAKERQRLAERAEDRDYRRMERAESRDMRRESMEAAKEARSTKQAELNASQAKQLGLYELGMKAEEQYNRAISNPKEYDPTRSGQFIDNSEWAPNLLKNKKAIEAQAAQSNWVEAFLRDASGAAIPPSERMAYAVDFFPQPGDPPDVVANKAEMRKQKMQNALTGAGSFAKPKAQASQQFPMQVRKGNQVATVRNAEELKEAKAEGWN